MDFPLAVSFEPLSLTDPAAAQLPRAFIHATRKPHGDMWRPFADRARATGWVIREIDTGHHVPVIRPSELAQRLMGLVGAA